MAVCHCCNVVLNAKLPQDSQRELRRWHVKVSTHYSIVHPGIPCLLVWAIVNWIGCLTFLSLCFLKARNHVFLYNYVYTCTCVYIVMSLQLALLTLLGVDSAFIRRSYRIVVFMMWCFCCMQLLLQCEGLAVQHRGSAPVIIMSLQITTRLVSLPTRVSCIRMVPYRLPYGYIPVHVHVLLWEGCVCTYMYMYTWLYVSVYRLVWIPD